MSEMKEKKKKKKGNSFKTSPDIVVTSGFIL